MTRLRLLAALLTVVLPALFVNGEPVPKRSAKEALQPFNDLIGSWRAAGSPLSGTREEKQKGFWTETVTWKWHIKGDDFYLVADFADGKYFKSGELRHVPASDGYRMTIRTVDKQTLVFDGTFENKRLTLERTDDRTNETQRLVFSLLHDNRHLYRYEVRPAGKSSFTAVYQVGATKEGVAFAGPDGKPECIVSGGLGTIKVTYKDKTYYVCCSGCRDAFNDEPEKYIREFEARKAKMK
jgi:hypothetical protein